MEKAARNNIIQYIKAAKVVKRPRGNPGGLTLAYKDVIAAFDIETSTDPESNNAFMYAWGFGVDKLYVMGRTWDEFLELMEDLKKVAEGAAIPVYIHKLSFEFVFLSGILDFLTGDVLCGEKRDIIKAYVKPFEFRCSWKLTGVSLETLTETYNVEHKKLKGYNYNKLRYPWTPLSKSEKKYLEHDVRGLIEVIGVQMSLYNDTIYTIPITKTGYTRREINKRMRTYPWEYSGKQKINLEIYRLLSLAMRGGNVYANRYLKDQEIPDVYGLDICSAYSAAIVFGLVPMGRWVKINKPNLNELIELIYRRNKAVLVALKFTNPRLKWSNDPFPYISAASRKSLIEGDAKIDSNRVLEVKGTLTGVYTEIDLDIILKQYEFDDVEIIEAYKTKKGHFPNQIRELFLELFEKKTKLKGTPYKEVYHAVKVEQNGGFGCFAQDPGKLYSYYVDGKYEPSGLTKEQVREKKEAIAAVNIEKSKTPYTWGVWIPAIVRGWTYEVLRELGRDAVYIDTDGIKAFRGNLEPFQRFNEKIEALAAEVPGATVPDVDGVLHTLGCWETEGHYELFKTLGPKKYAYIEDGVLKVTTSGINKEKASREIASLAEYKEGTTFHEAAGNEARYNDFVDMWVEREGHQLHITRNVALFPSTFTLGETEEFKRMLHFKKAVNKFFEGGKNEI